MNKLVGIVGDLEEHERQEVTRTIPTSQQVVPLRWRASGIGRGSRPAEQGPNPASNADRQTTGQGETITKPPLPQRLI